MNRMERDTLPCLEILQNAFFDVDTPQKGLLENFGLTEFGDRCAHFDQNGPFRCPDVGALSSRGQRELLLSLGIRPALRRGILGDGRTVGLAGFGVCRGPRGWAAWQVGALTMASRILSVFLVMVKAKTRLVRTAAKINWGRKPAALTACGDVNRYFSVAALPEAGR